VTRYFGIAELAIVVTDIDKAQQFYVDLRGFERTDVDYGEGSRILKIGDQRYLGL